ncbi:hypothetical protein COEREDRAFT_39873 [Coemansia reversa NRRL 1564]|uniref:Queuosine 5'-phosphate N-glycosylase/hydrolase n=1 Tax=Coemansia reversa (strain ATCC 12441 / NRRL 1564) TaxID=763665 RepID=A0A2G5BHL7_COERN|nr:hypothetical protein COEREDRAFT_39873 [Coemansia reversa NRRL 1564]|eukprot:PIA18227.1 hypothetical protein COEREDRAFT_39873 [Coemansia reversa NRRL 1564]
MDTVGHSLVTVCVEKSRCYADSFDGTKFESHVKYINNWTHKLPLVFDNLAQELNLISLLGLLQVGSGFRRELHEMTGRGAADTMRFGCISLHISQTQLDAKGLQALTLGEISQNFGIPLLGEERPVISGTTAVMMSEPSVLRPLADIILGCLQDTGRRLERGGFASLSDFVIRICAEKPTAAHLVEKLVNAFPSLRDAADVDGQQVYLFRKAQLLAYDICQRFGSTDARFAFPDIGDMSLFADSVAPVMAQHHGMLVPCEAIALKIRDGRELTLAETTAMRAASIVAAQQIVSHVNSPVLSRMRGKFSVNQVTLGSFWWREGKESELRDLKRLICKKTVYF